MSVDTTNSHREDGGDLLDALVDAERAAMEPPEHAQAQTWERVVGTVALGTPPPVPPSSVATPAASSTAPWLKIVLGVLLGGAVAAIGYGVTADDPPATATAPPTATRADATPSPSAPAALPQPEPAPALAPPPPAPAPPAQQPAKEVRAASKAADPPASDLAEETRLLALARASLRAGSAAKALVPLAEHARRFPRGQLAEDRMVLRAQALCESGERSAGRKAAAALRKAFPGSSHLPRVDRACR
ncbi:MAG: hypothetical protein ACE37F_11520 [Nannocystaceae bacterium]|nr:hypothetical protein [bacterium]